MDQTLDTRAHAPDSWDESLLQARQDVSGRHMRRSIQDAKISDKESQRVSIRILRDKEYGA